MQLWQRGITNVLSVTLGAGYFSQEWVDQLKDVKRIVVCFDNDDA
jgi:DNA primase